MDRSAGRLVAIFCLVIITFIVTGLVHRSAVESLISTLQNQPVERQVAVELADLVRLATLAETGQRGFVITGRDDYLAPYLEARDRIPQVLAGLRQALRSDAQQLQRLDRLDELNRMKMAELAESIAARRNGGFGAAAAIVLTDRGKTMMDDIRRTVADLDRVESAKLAERMRAADASTSKVFRTIALAGVLDLGLLILLFIYVRRFQQRRDAAALERANAAALLRNVIDGSPALIYLNDLDGNFILTNQTFETIFGPTAGKTVQQVVAALPYLGGADRLQETDLAVIRGNRTIQYEQEVHTADGMRRHLFVSKTALRDHLGRIIGLCAVAADVTPLKLAENEIRTLNQSLEKRVDERTGELAQANEKLHEVNEQLESFSYTVAHDLRAPLRGLQGFAEAVQEDYANLLDPTGQDFLRRIVNAACRMERLIEDLLAFSRLSRMELSIGQVSLDAVMTEVTHNLSSAIADSRATVSVQPALPPVQANWSACVQIFQNLLGNAIKFARPGHAPEVQVEAQRLPLMAGSGQRMIRVWVSDAGIGIATEHLQRIFRPFERLHGVDEYPGTGIGLAIVDKAARRMGGGCGVEQPAGGGSRFWVDLPACMGSK